MNANRQSGGRPNPLLRIIRASRRFAGLSILLSPIGATYRIRPGSASNNSTARCTNGSAAASACCFFGEGRCVACAAGAPAGSWCVVRIKPVRPPTTSHSAASMRVRFAGRWHRSRLNFWLSGKLTTNRPWPSSASTFVAMSNSATAPTSACAAAATFQPPSASSSLTARLRGRRRSHCSPGLWPGVARRRSRRRLRCRQTPGQRPGLQRRWRQLSRFFLRARWQPAALASSLPQPPAPATSPVRSCSTSIAISSRSCRWQIRTIAISASVRTCVLTRSRAAVWSSICDIASSVCNAQSLGDAANFLALRRAGRRATGSRCSRRPASSRRGSSPAVGRSAARLRRPRRSPRRVPPAPPPRRGPPAARPAGSAAPPARGRAAR